MMYGGWMVIFRRAVCYLFVFSLALGLLARSALPLADKTEQVRAYTRMVEFDYANWMIAALGVKSAQAALSAPVYLSDDQHIQLIQDYLSLVRQIERIEDEIELIYSDPGIVDPAWQAAPLAGEHDRLHEMRRRLAPLSESILQGQVSAVLDEMRLSVGGQPLPPVLYHITPMPQALIVSPRSVIQQDANISLLPELTFREIIALEQEVEENLDVSALVVPIGGVGVYPTMVMSSTNLPWLVEVIAHEWTHNFLTLRPLGIRYEVSAELRTMNETAATIAGKEIGQAVLAKYYPQYLPPPPSAPSAQAVPERQTPAEPPPFDFRAEMHETRLTADRLLAEGKITEAEAYMEERREFFWENGYRLRRLNQAYFAFHGAYADEPGGAAGEDPVGPAVRALRQQSPSLAEFIDRISWMTSFADLQEAVR